MGLNDEREKLRQAEQWMIDCDVNSHHFLAAWEHLTWIYGYARVSRDLKDEAGRIINDMTGSIPG
jgi:hypothetical protein